MELRARRNLAVGAAVLAFAFASAGRGAAQEGKAAAAPAAKAPALKLNVYFPADFTDAAYQKAAFQTVLSSWAPKGPTPAAGKKTVVVARIGKDGKLLGLDYNLRSGSAPFDTAAAEAVKKAAPFKPLPAGYPQSSIEVHWHFEVGG